MKTLGEYDVKNMGCGGTGILSLRPQPFLGLRFTSHFSCPPPPGSCPKCFFFSHSPPNQSEGGARRGGREWGSRSPHWASLLLGVGGERGVLKVRIPGQGLLPPAAALGARAPRSAASPPPEPARSARPSALRTSGARALRSSSEQLHNDASVSGGGAAFVIAIRLSSGPQVLINRSLKCARLGFTYAD